MAHLQLKRLKSVRFASGCRTDEAGDDLLADCSPLCAEAGQLAAPAFRAAPVAEELPPTSSVSSVSSSEPPSFESGPFALSVSTPMRNAEPGLLIQSSPNFDSDIIDGDLDDLLDSAGPESPMVCELEPCFCNIHIRFCETFFFFPHSILE